jgi:transglycosylase-like protein with SLT domain
MAHFRQILRKALLTATCTMGVWLACPVLASPTLEEETAPPRALTICEIVSQEARRQKLPEWFFARLIWKESAFNPKAVSPKGAQGIAQFMPATAKTRGLIDPFTAAEALKASAHFLAELLVNLGNLGLAAAAYNAGEDRVRKWLAGSSSLPLETLDYVYSITGRPANDWAEADVQHTVPPQDKKKFVTDCVTLASRGAEPSTASGAQRSDWKPWGVQVAGSHSEAAALASFRRVRSRFSDVLGGVEPLVVRKRNPGMGPRRVVNVRIGTATRGEADRLCAKLLAKGCACVVLRN